MKHGGGNDRRQPTRRRPWRAARLMCSLGSAALLTMTSACATDLASLSLAATAADREWPVMVLARNVEARSCAHRALFGLLPLGSQATLHAALDSAIGQVQEAEVLTDARLELETTDLLLLRRQCVRVVGAVGRRVRVIHVH